MLELGQTERLHQRRDVHPEAPPQPLLDAVIATDRIGLVAPPRLDRALLGRLALVSAAQLDPVLVREQHRLQVLDTAQLVAQLRLADLADEHRRVGRLVAVHHVLRRPRGRLQHPRVLFRARSGRAWHLGLLWLRQS